MHLYRYILINSKLKVKIKKFENLIIRSDRVNERCRLAYVGEYWKFQEKLTELFRRIDVKRSATNAAIKQ